MATSVLWFLALPVFTQLSGSLATSVLWFSNVARFYPVIWDFGHRCLVVFWCCQFLPSYLGLIVSFFSSRLGRGLWYCQCLHTYWAVLLLFVGVAMHHIAFPLRSRHWLLSASPWFRAFIRPSFWRGVLPGVGCSSIGGGPRRVTPLDARTRG